MASTTFVDGSTVIVSSWLNDVNNLVYNGVFQSTATSLTGSLTVPVVKSSGTLSLQTNGSTTAIYADTSQNVGLGTTSLISGFRATVAGSLIASGSLTGYGTDPNLTTGSSRVFADFTGSVGRIGTATGSGSGGTLSFVVNNNSQATLDGSGNFVANGNITATGQFSGPGTGLTGTAASLNIGGNAATVTNGLTTVNYNSYAPTLTGTGASGTWNISISGNAVTATTSGYITNSAYNGFGLRTVSTSAPSGGTNGDIWYQV